MANRVSSQDINQLIHLLQEISVAVEGNDEVLVTGDDIVNLVVSELGYLIESSPADDDITLTPSTVEDEEVDALMREIDSDSECEPHDENAADDDPWMESVPDQNGNLIDNTGRIEVHKPIVNLGSPGFARPHLNLEYFCYLACDCRHHHLPQCCRSSSFEYFSSNPYSPVDLNAECQLANNAFIENDPHRPANNLQRKRLCGKVFVAMDFDDRLKGERRRLPNCVCAKIRQLYPDESGFYMEYKEGRRVIRQTT